MKIACNAMSCKHNIFKEGSFIPQCSKHTVRLSVLPRLDKKVFFRCLEYEEFRA